MAGGDGDHLATAFSVRNGGFGGTESGDGGAGSGGLGRAALARALAAAASAATLAATFAACRTLPSTFATMERRRYDWNEHE